LYAAGPSGCKSKSPNTHACRQTRVPATRTRARVSPGETWFAGRAPGYIPSHGRSSTTAPARALSPSRARAGSRPGAARSACRAAGAGRRAGVHPGRKRPSARLVLEARERVAVGVAREKHAGGHQPARTATRKRRTLTRSRPGLVLVARPGTWPRPGLVLVNQRSLGPGSVADRSARRSRVARGRISGDARARAWRCIARWC